MEQVNGTSPVSRRPKNQQIPDLVKKFDKTQGITIKAFCKLHQISEGSFFYYRSRQRERVAPFSSKPSGFIPIAQPVTKESVGVLFAEVNGIKLYQPVPADYLKALIV